MDAATLPRPVLPKRIKKADQRWHKGLFVAANVAIEDGVPLFGQVNSEWVLKGMINRLCQMCGQHISDRLPCVFPGGPSDWLYSEAPLHVECARYAMLVCPRILARRENYTFSVCSRYDLWGSGGEIQGCVPKAPKARSALSWSLLFAHPDGCGHTRSARLSFDEFLAWSGA